MKHFDFVAEGTTPGGFPYITGVMAHIGTMETGPDGVKALVWDQSKYQAHIDASKDAE